MSSLSSSSLASSSPSRVIIITGASRGLGLAISKLILKYPSTNITMVARSEEKLNAFFQSLSDEVKPRVLIISGDITSSVTIDNVIDETLKKFKKIDSVIFNAGVLAPVGHLGDEDLEINKVKELFDVNFFSIVEFIQKLLLKLNKNDSFECIFVSSGASVKNYDGWMAYGSSKACVNVLCKHLHEENFPRIKSISIAPGVVDTEMQKDIREVFSAKMSDEGLKKFTDLHKNGELLPPEVPGSVYAKIAVNGIDDKLSGEYVRWNSI